MEISRQIIERGMNMINTPYDDVFRTLLNDCPKLIIPVINEIFQEHYTGNEEIRFLPNEHFLNRQGGKEDERITDSAFVIQSPEPKNYHMECQSTPDNSMLVRIFEYDAQIALDNGRIQGDTLTVEFPNSAVLFLRCDAKTPNQLKLCLKTPGGDVRYNIPVMKQNNYEIDKIFQKDLLFLIPFNIFTHESKLPEYDGNKVKLEELKQEYVHIREKLEELCRDKHIDEYTKCTIVDMSDKVIEHIAAKYENVKEGVKSVMGGKILEYEAKTIKNEGITQGMIKAYVDLVNDGIITLKEAAGRLHVSEKEILSFKDNSTAVQIKEGSVLEKLDAFKQETGKNEQQPKTPVKNMEELQK